MNPQNPLHPQTKLRPPFIPTDPMNPEGAIALPIITDKGMFLVSEQKVSALNDWLEKNAKKDDRFPFMPFSGPSVPPPPMPNI